MLRDKFNRIIQVDDQVVFAKKGHLYIDKVQDVWLISGGVGCANHVYRSATNVIKIKKDEPTLAVDVHQTKDDLHHIPS